MDPHRPHLTDPPAMVRLRTVERSARRMIREKYWGWAEADRDELLGEVLEKYFTKWGRGPGPEPLGPWLAVVVKHAAIDRHDKDVARRVKPVDFNDPGSGADWGVIGALRDLRTPSLLSMRGMAAHQALDRLAEKHPRDRDLVRWRHIHGEDFQTIADRTGQNKEAARKAVQRAVARLKAVVLASDDLHEALLDRR